MTGHEEYEPPIVTDIKPVTVVGREEDNLYGSGDLLKSHLQDIHKLLRP